MHVSRRPTELDANGHTQRLHNTPIGHLERVSDGQVSWTYFDLRLVQKLVQ